MALQIIGVSRVFKHKNNTLQDPNPAFTPEQVLTYYTNQYPELVTASINGPEIKDEKATYEFKSVVGTKG